MAGAPATKRLITGSSSQIAPPTHPLVRWLLVSIAIVFLTLFIVVPVANVFTQALSKGLGAYTRVFQTEVAPESAVLSLAEKRKLSQANSQAEKTVGSIKLTIGVACFVIPLNILFGLSAAWAITKFKFRGRALLMALIDLPFSISPVIAGLVFVLLLGRNGAFGDFATHLVWPNPASVYWRGFSENGFPFAFSQYYTGIIFTPFAIILASIFVTFPFVARSLIPLMETQGTDEEIAAVSLGASGWRTFWTVTLPNVKWALLYGTILCTARVFGEFGAVSVVSGHIDSNDTMPLRIEKLWNEYNNQAAFTVASLLASLAVVTLIVKTFIEFQTSRSADDAKVKGG